MRTEPEAMIDMENRHRNQLIQWRIELKILWQ